IVTIAGPEINSAARERLAGYKAALKKHNIALDEDLILAGGFNTEKSFTVMKEFLEKKIEFTAIFASSGGAVIPAFNALEEVGLKIGKDISLNTIDIPHFEVPFSCVLDTFSQPLFEVGKKAAEILLQRMSGKLDKEFTDHFVEGSYREGDSVFEI
ncbi:MAG: substrate-binding domain-containing protein, partial [Planctomycetes bacterium]|nr:substrate-binding domain-containing protein [Planctomycetota bacterium]